MRVPYTLPEQDDSACLRPKDFLSPREASAAWKLEHKPPLHDVSAVVTPIYEIVKWVSTGTKASPPLPTPVLEWSPSKT